MNPSNITNGAQVKSTNADTIQIGSSIQTSDGATSPITSPKTFTTNLTITVPANAVELVLEPSNAITVSELSNSASSFKIPASAVLVINVARMKNVYLTESTGATVVNFYFTLV